MRRTSLAIVALLAFSFSAVAQTKHYEAPAFTADFPAQDEIKYVEQAEKDGNNNPIMVDTYTQRFEQGAGFSEIGYYASNHALEWDPDKSVQGQLSGCTSRGKVSDFELTPAKIGYIDGQQLKFVCTAETEHKVVYVVSRVAFLAPGTLWVVSWMTSTDQPARAAAFLDSIVVKRR